MTDPRSLNALDVAERYADGAATMGELSSAGAAAGDAARAAAGDAALDEQKEMFIKMCRGEAPWQ